MSARKKAETPWRQRITSFEEVDPREIIANPRNFRTHPGEQRDALQAVMERVGVIAPVVVNRATGNLVDGHLRVRLAIQTGQPTVHVAYVDLTEAEEAEALTTFDALGALAGQDDEMLKDLLRGMELDDERLAPILAELGHSLPKSVLFGLGKDEDEVPEPPEDPITHSGDLWILGDHRLLCGDSTKPEEVGRLLSGAKVHMVFTDPPYGVSFQSHRSKGGTATRFDVIANDDKILEIAAIVWGSMREDAAAFVWTSDHVYPQWREQFASFYKQTVIWYKGGGGIGDLEGAYATDYEMALFCVKGRPTFRDKRRMAVWEISKDRAVDYVHPTQKPVALAEQAIRDFSDAGDKVMDLFGGSGSTLIACEKTGRCCFAMEIDPRYCDVIVQRWEGITGQKAILEKKTKPKRSKP